MHFINVTSNYFQRLGKTKHEFKNFIKRLIREKSTHARDLICVLHAAVPQDRAWRQGGFDNASQSLAVGFWP